MSQGRLQFRLSHLLAATTVIAAILTSIAYLPSTYETDGAVGSGFIGMLLILSWLVGGICLRFRRLRIATFVVVLLICCVFSFRQAILIHRLHLLENEVPRIVAYIDAFKNEHGEYPETLSDYVYQRPELQTYIKYIPPKTNRATSSLSFSVRYDIRYHPYHTKDFAHWYSPGHGYWYEDD